MSGRSNLNEILEVLEEIRSAKYPEIPAEVIRDIVLAQYENQDTRLEGKNRTNAIVTAFLNSVVKSEEG